MDWKVLLSTFGLIFLAEMGDKTQLAAITMVAKTKAPWAVFIGASLALCAVSLMGVFAGTILVRYIPAEQLQKVAAMAFILIGLLMLWGKL
jgi:putative Ca2+/H+ antiporter (TMEM165/GDT1 family)